MNEPESTDIIQVVYTAAQLVADDLEEAARLVERVFSESEPTTAQEALARLQRAASGMDTRRQGILAARLRLEKLDRVVQEALAVLPVTRRLAVLEAYLHPEAQQASAADPATERSSAGDLVSVRPERTVFLYAVRRAMDERGSLAVTVADITDALDRTIGASAAPVPPALRSVVESTLARRRSMGSGDARTAYAGGNSPANRTRPGVRFAGALAVILVASLLGIWFGRPANPADNRPGLPPDLFSVLAQSSSDEIVFTGSSTEQAERVLLDRFAIRAAVPDLDGGVLESLSVVHVGEESDIPVLHYAEDGSTSMDVFVVPYIYLEDYRFEWSIPNAVLDQLAEVDGVDIAVNDQVARIAWRVRDDIYVTFTTGDPMTVRTRFRF